MSLLVHNARKVDAGGVSDDAWVYVSGERIEATGTGTTWRDDVGARASDGVVRVDAQGMTLTPGFIDLHAHGGAGHRFEDGLPAIEAALAVHRRNGTTRSVVSLASSDLDSLARSLTDVAVLAARDPLVLGSHLEGPYLSPNRCGAHDPAVLRAPRLDEVTALVGAAGGALRQVTIAPELPGALDAIRQLTTQGVVAAVGHTEADYARTRAAFDAGATVLTHAYNGMPGIGHRAPGPVVAAFDDDRVCLEIINDGHHVDPRVVALTFATAPGRVALITDAMAATGAGDGDFRLGGQVVRVTDGVARLTGTGTLAGSTITLDVALRGALQAGIPEQVAVAAATSVPAAALGLGHRLGRLSVGYAADLVLLDAAWRVVTVVADGAQLFD
ncbi:MAG: N-acetylglucosamine-6-phosphate deacetylase [Nocardioidaceae bacterium]|nr:N-acetylglucosamine-6-phosphate deacetylase [Nocardioidaceae bacterium]